MKRVYRDDTLAVNIIWYGRGVTEPRHVHDGTHATWVLVGGATMDAETIGPCDLVYGPGGVPHGPLVYEMGCMLFGTLYGGALHSAVEGDATSPTADGLPPHLATQRDHPWEADGHVFGIGETKTLVRDPARDYTARMLRVPAGSTARGTVIRVSTPPS